MKKLILLFFIGGIILTTLFGCTENVRTKQWGGKMTVQIPKGNKFVNATWKNGDLWYLYKPMLPNEEPETFIFQEQSSFGMMEGIITFQESK